LFVLLILLALVTIACLLAYACCTLVVHRPLTTVLHLHCSVLCHTFHILQSKIDIFVPVRHPRVRCQSFSDEAFIVLYFSSTGVPYVASFFVLFFFVLCTLLLPVFVLFLFVLCTLCYQFFFISSTCVPCVPSFLFCFSSSCVPYITSFLFCFFRLVYPIITSF